MLVSQSHILLPAAFFILLAISMISSLTLLFPKIPLKFIQIHISIMVLPPIVSLAGLVLNNGSMILGPWRLDSLSWLLATFVMTINFIVQRYSVRYLLGDHSYRKYFSLLTMSTAADSLAWLSDDLHLLMLFWGVTLLGLTILIGLKKEWQIAKNASAHTGRMFFLSWFILLLAVIWVTHLTGHWQLSQILNKSSLMLIRSWERTCINLLLIVAVAIPAAQWPFQRWLLDSVVAPTPISAVMHGGIVNAGGIMLCRFAPLFNGSAAQIILLILSSISVLIGTGMMLVQVDYKRQLVCSTIAQMGFMLIQCALGAYWAAIIHAILHGLFKATLFLQAGSAVHHKEPIYKNGSSVFSFWPISGIILGILAGIAFWFTAPDDGYQWISSIILGWAVTIAWSQLVGSGDGPISRIAGIALFTGFAAVFGYIHTALSNLLHETVSTEIQSYVPADIFLLVILITGSAIGAWLFRHRNTPAFAVLYLRLIQLSEPQTEMVESHPRYLTQSLSQGGNFR